MVSKDALWERKLTRKSEPNIGQNICEKGSGSGSHTQGRSPKRGQDRHAGWTVVGPRGMRRASAYHVGSFEQECGEEGICECRRKELACRQ